MDQNEFSAAMQEAYRQALDNADAIVRNAEKIREEAIGELRLAREKHKEAELKAEQLVADYYEQKRRQFTEAARVEQMRNLVRYHIEDGKTTDAIVSWLRVKPEFVKAIRDVVQRVEALRNGKSTDRERTGGSSNHGQSNDGHNRGGESTSRESNARVAYTQSGRGGTVTFENDETSFDLWWEFAGGGAAAIVAIPTEVEWERKTRLPLARRMDIVNHIAVQILRDQFSRGHFLIGDSVITFYS
jgi:hypothetical protein